MTPDQHEEKKQGNADAAVKPDEETLHTTDPQEHMEGPLSSIMQKVGEGLDNKESVETDSEKKED